MADKFKFDLVSPERRLASEEVDAVQIPGAEGDLTAMAHHAPMITTLRPGILRVENAGGHQDYVVTGGFAEIGESVSVLAEQAIASGDVTQELYDALVSDAQSALDAAKAEKTDQIDMLSKSLAELALLAERVGLTSKFVTL